MIKSLPKNICNEPLFEQFFKTNAKALRNYLFSKFGNMDEAEDTMQEAFTKLWDNCAKVRPEKAKSYLYTVATNLGLSIKRHEQVKFRHQDLVLKNYKQTTNESPEFILLEEEFMQKFKAALGKLTDRQREVFLLNRIENKTYREIAEQSEVSVKAIEKLMHKALFSLKESLDGVKI